MVINSKHIHVGGGGMLEIHKTYPFSASNNAAVGEKFIQKDFFRTKFTKSLPRFIKAGNTVIFEGQSLNTKDFLGPDIPGKLIEYIYIYFIEIPINISRSLAILPHHFTLIFFLHNQGVL